MLVLNVNYYAKPGMRDAFLKETKEIEVVKKSQEEPGNITYEYFLPVDDENRIFLLEQWKDEEAFEIHKKEPHFQALQPIKEKYLEKSVLEIYKKD